MTCCETIQYVWIFMILKMQSKYWHNLKLYIIIDAWESNSQNVIKCCLFVDNECTIIVQLHSQSCIDIFDSLMPPAILNHKFLFFACIYIYVWIIDTRNFSNIYMYKDFCCVFTGIAFTKMYTSIITNTLKIWHLFAWMHVVLLFYVCLHVVCITYKYIQKYTYNHVCIV